MNKLLIGLFFLSFFLAADRAEAQTSQCGPTGTAMVPNGRGGLVRVYCDLPAPPPLLPTPGAPEAPRLPVAAQIAPLPRALEPPPLPPIVTAWVVAPMATPRPAPVEAAAAPAPPVAPPPPPHGVDDRVVRVDFGAVDAAARTGRRTVRETVCIGETLTDARTLSDHSACAGWSDGDPTVLALRVPRSWRHPVLLLLSRFTDRRTPAGWQGRRVSCLGPRVIGLRVPAEELLPGAPRVDTGDRDCR